MRGSTAGLGDTLQSHNRPHTALLAILDVSFSCLVVAPAVVGYWRGTWNLAAIYIYEHDPVLSCFISMGIGFVGHVALMLSADAFKRKLHPDKSRLAYYFWSRVYTYLFSIVSVNSWRGPWGLLELAVGRGGSMAPTWVSLVALAALRCLRNITAPPFSLVIDKPKEYFDVPSMFRVPSSGEPVLFVLDCLFSVVVVGSLVVFVWRGVWDFFDVILFPDDLAWSAFGSLILGYGLAVLTFLMQPAARKICEKLSGAPRLLAADVFLLISFISTINVWRSIWMLLDIYFLPDDKILSNWITHGVCIGILMLLNCANSVLVRGVYIDAEEDGGQCVVFPCYYLRLFFQKERMKKRQRRLEMMAKASSIDVDTPHGVLPLLNTKPNNHVIKDEESGEKK